MTAASAASERPETLADIGARITGAGAACARAAAEVCTAVLADDAGADITGALARAESALAGITLAGLAIPPLLCLDADLTCCSLARSACAAADTGAALGRARVAITHGHGTLPAALDDAMTGAAVLARSLAVAAGALDHDAVTRPGTDADIAACAADALAAAIRSLALAGPRHEVDWAVPAAALARAAAEVAAAVPAADSGIRTADAARASADITAALARASAHIANIDQPATATLAAALARASTAIRCGLASLPAPAPTALGYDAYEAARAQTDTMRGLVGLYVVSALQPSTHDDIAGDAITSPAAVAITRLAATALTAAMAADYLADTCGLLAVAISANRGPGISGALVDCKIRASHTATALAGAEDDTP